MKTLLLVTTIALFSGLAVAQSTQDEQRKPPVQINIVKPQPDIFGN